MGRAFARPLILPWTWILSNLSSNIYASLFLCGLAANAKMLMSKCKMNPK